MNNKLPKNCAQFSALILLLCLPALDSQVSHGGGQFENQKLDTEESQQFTQYLLHKLLSGDNSNFNPSQRAAAEEQIFSAGGASIIYPQYVSGAENPIKRYLDEAKEQIDVIDFRRPRRKNYVRVPRQDQVLEEDLAFSDGSSPKKTRNAKRGSRGSASEQVPIKLAFPGNEFEKSTFSSGCTNCVPDGAQNPNRWTMPLQQLGDKQYYLGIFFKANWYKAEQYCRFHGMHLASINSAEEQKQLQEHIQAFGMGQEHFWTSGTDQAEEGKFFWLSTGKPVTYTNWNAGEPNNFEYEDGEQEHCLEMWDRDGKGLGWNDTPCSFQTFFICESES